ncbi:DUF434 domain-containing protein [Methanolobus sp. WCC4]|uniref:DUF434 domain-containing protein n=1 Tax=Methanolobus sp. WCC4 TaxID=3125784 RepID=UPI0030F85C2E
MTEKNAPAKDELREGMKEAAAAADLRYLLERGYRRDSSIRFVGDHYGIGRNDRYILARTVFSDGTARERKKKMVQCDQLQNRSVLVDGYNVLITLESLLRGERVWLADDSFLRDIRGVFRNHSNDRFTTEAVEEMLSFFVMSEVGTACILLDSQMKHSGDLASFIRKRMHELSITGDAKTSKHVDHDLKNCDGSYIVATADGIIIDSVGKVIDIPGCIYRNKASVKIPYISTNHR